MKRQYAPVLLWIAALLLLSVAAQSPLALEMLVLLSGILAILFSALLALLMYLMRKDDDWVVLLRGALFLLFILSPLALLAAAFGVVPIVLLVPGFLLFVRYFPRWHDLHEDPRLEPIAFLVLGQKMVFVFFLLLAGS